MEPMALARSLGVALLIGFLLGAERESSREEGEQQPGIRDFILIALTGAICGLLQVEWLTFAAALVLGGLLAVFHFRSKERTGITTEIAAVATFCLGFLAANPKMVYGAGMAIALTIVIAALLEAKRGLHRFIRQTITESEFLDTLRFLAIIFIIYPLLPEASFGPNRMVSPRHIWLFVILVSSVSYAGYFLEKFLGSRRGLRLAGILGGIASSTAATASLARGCSEEREKTPAYTQAAVLANTIQLPRVLAILLAVAPGFASAAAVPLSVMTLAGLFFAVIVIRVPESSSMDSSIGLRNPFRLLPALKFGAVFALVLIATRAAGLALGGGAALAVSAISGAVDADAVALSLSELLSNGAIDSSTAVGGLLLALLANAVVKAVIAWWTAPPQFRRQLAAAFVVMYTSGALAWVALTRPALGR